MCQFSAKLDKNGGPQLLTSTDTQNCWITLYTHVIVMASSNFLTFWRGFVSEYQHVKFSGLWTTSEGDTEGGKKKKTKFTPMGEGGSGH